VIPNALLDEILRLPPDQRLQLVEDVWDSLAASPDRIGVPAWHRDELDRRLVDPTDKATLSWQDMQARLRRPTP
jgi:putative addiction module component (TIGR02574 family)